MHQKVILEKKFASIRLTSRDTWRKAVTSHLIASFIFKHVASHFKPCKVFELFIRVVNGGAWPVLCDILRWLDYEN